MHLETLIKRGFDRENLKAVVASMELRHINMFMKGTTV
jgi:hypothetical protein